MPLQSSSFLLANYTFLEKGVRGLGKYPKCTPAPGPCFLLLPRSSSVLSVPLTHSFEPGASVVFATSIACCIQTSDAVFGPKVLTGFTWS